MLASIKRYWLVLLVVGLIAFGAIGFGGYWVFTQVLPNLGPGGEMNVVEEVSEEEVTTSESEEPTTAEITPSEFISYDEFVANAPESCSVVRIEGYYLYAFCNGTWYEAFPAQNYDAQGNAYASGFATGDVVSALEVRSHWTQFTLLDLTVTKIGPDNLILYSDYVNDLTDGYHAVLIEDTYLYVAFVHTEYGTKYIRWYEAEPAQNFAANGYAYANGLATGELVPETEVMSHWTQITIIPGEATDIQP